jgi:hypothetical protein
MADLVKMKTPLNGGGCPVDGYFLEDAVTLLGKKFAFSVRGFLDFTLATWARSSPKPDTYSA